MSPADGAVNARAERTGTLFGCGDLRIDVGRQRVWQAGRELALPKLSFELLLALVRSAPNVLSIDALNERVWGHVIVSPETVIQRVKLLRDALTDSPQEPRYIGSLRGRGYFLIPAVVDAVPDAHPAPAPALQPAPPAVPPGEGVSGNAMWMAARRPLIVVATAVALGLVGWSLYVARHNVKLPAPEVVTAPASSESAITPDINTVARTIAVMPFRNLGRESDEGFLATGLPEMILNRLASVRNLAVVARSSSFALDPTVGDALEIGRRLHSGHIVEGNVQRDGDRVRVTAQLIDTSTGTLLWSDSYDRRVRDIFALEDDISNRIAAVLTDRIAGLEVSREPQEHTANVAAQLSYFHGLALLGRQTVADSVSAIPLFEKAIALDPGFAGAYAALYEAHMQAAVRQRQDLAAPRARWQPLIDEALTLNPRSGAAHFARAMWGGGSLHEREADFKLGLELDPSNGRAITAYSKFVWDDDSAGDRVEEARRILQRALWIDPLSPSARWLRAMQLDNGSPAVVEQLMLQVLEVDPNYLPALQRYGMYRWLFHGQLAEAVQIIEHAIALDPQNPVTRLTAAAIYLDLGDETAARDAAAGSPASERGSRHLLDLYRGDWRRAGVEAYGSPTWDYTTLQNWGASEAVHDYALRSGEIERAVQFLERQYTLAPGPKLAIELGNFRQAAMLADLFAAQSRNAEAAQLRAAAAAWNDGAEAQFGALYAKRLRARLWLIAGKRDAALQELADSFHASDYVEWWYTLERDMVWLPVHDDPRFRAIDAQVREYVAKQRAMVDELRRRGEIPRRDGLASTPRAAAAAAVATAR